MGLSSTTILYIAELLFYMTLFPVTLYLGIRHGKHGFLGWFYLNAFCALRIAADIVQIIERHQPASQPTVASAILGSLGLSPLLLSVSGFLHEVHHYHLKATVIRAQALKAKRWLWLAQFQIHVASGTGMIFIIIGSISLVSAKTKTEENHDDKLRSIGAMLLFLLWFGLCQYALWLFIRCRRAATRTRQHFFVLIGTLVALPFVGIRSTYSVLYTFDHSYAALNPVTGSFAVKLILVVLVQLLAAAALIVGGYRAKDIADGRYSGLEIVCSDEPVQDAISDSSYGGHEPKQVLLGTEGNGQGRVNWA